MSQTPLVDRHVVNGPNPWIHAENARGIEIKLREEIAAANRKSEVVLRAVRYAAGVEEGRDALQEISQMKHRIRRLIEERDSARIQADHKWKLREELRRYWEQTTSRRAWRRSRR